MSEIYDPIQWLNKEGAKENLEKFIWAYSKAFPRTAKARQGPIQIVRNWWEEKEFELVFLLAVAFALTARKNILSALLRWPENDDETVH